MSLPPIIGYILFAAFAIGIASPLALASAGQKDRPGAMAGIYAGTLLSIPAGLLTGLMFWSLLEEATALPGELVLFFGPVIGCFIGTFVVASFTREVGTGIAGSRQPSDH